MATSVQKAGKALAAVGDRLDPVATQQQTKQFAREDAKQQAVQSLMDEAMLDTLGSEDLDEGAKVLVQQILDEAGVELKASLASVPAGVPGLPEGSQAVPATAEHEDDGELSRQLAALRAA